MTWNKYCNYVITPAVYTGSYVLEWRLDCSSPVLLLPWVTTSLSCGVRCSAAARGCVKLGRCKVATAAGATAAATRNMQAVHEAIITKVEAATKRPHTKVCTRDEERGNCSPFDFLELETSTNKMLKKSVARHTSFCTTCVLQFFPS